MHAIIQVHVVAHVRLAPNSINQSHHHFHVKISVVHGAYAVAVGSTSIYIYADQIRNVAAQLPQDGKLYNHVDMHTGTSI